ncbi:hypothetical protein LOC67_14110 [Stieleria sp. JC731]|uniref:hypothetical protein n=1 Tax=Pirellulaceae TaxID=2691357 RepID=UPI001E39641E|nr:hypothetical protein [Stieleria sp. JC731]MCC9601689.1 hypothetical protein [Stieleria sp. JC731]
MNSADCLKESRFRYLALFWAGIVVVGWICIARYQFQTAAAGPIKTELQWPSDTEIPLASGQLTMLFFVHPKCPCTKASIHELKRVFDDLGENADLPSVVVIASVPKESGDNWGQTDILRQASQLPNSRLILDQGGKETARFDAKVSGTVMLYRPQGERIFVGGVTVSRGHEGPSVGGDQLVSLIERPARTLEQSPPVFGCGLCVDSTATADR